MAAAGAAEERASALIAKAEKKLNGMFSFGKGKYEEAAELYMQAAKQYQLAKNFNQAAACYEKVVGFHNELGSVLEMAMAYKEAGSMYEKAEKPNECCRVLEEAKNLFAQEGRLSECAKLAKRRAEIFEKAEITDLMIESYREAAELYSSEDSKGETRNCELKIAHYRALEDSKESIMEAIEIWEKVAEVSLESNLLKWSVKQYYMKALLAYLVLSSNQLGKTIEDVRDKRGEYCSLDPTFEATREDNLIMGAVEAIDEGDPEKFATACSEFDEITKLDQFQTTLLLKAKNGIDEPLGNEGGAEDDIC